KAGRVDNMQAIFDEGHADVNAEEKIMNDNGGEDSRTALAYACELGRNDAVTFLLSRDNIQVDFKCGKDGESALMYAIENGHVEVVRMLLDHGGVDINLVDKIGVSALMYASEKGLAEVVRMLLDHGGVDINLVDKRSGISALMYASEKGHAEVVRMLLDHGGVDINLVDKRSGVSALMYASVYGHAEVVRMLLDHGGVDINTGSSERSVCVNFDGTVGECVDQYFSGLSALMYASNYGHAGVVRMLLDHGGVDINVVDKSDKKSALMYASNYGRAEVVRMLLDHGGVDINVVDKSGLSALMYASNYGRAGVVRMLLDHGGVDINVVDKKGMTALSYSIKEDHLETVRLLSERNDIIIDKDVEYSIHQKNFAALATILESKVTYRSTNDDGKPLVECCAEYLKHESAMNMLGVDFPVEVQDGNLVQRQDYLYSWASFMDVTIPVDVNVRLGCLESILKDNKFASCSQELLRELAFGKDKHGREVIQITDASSRKYLNDQLFYCGRYEIFDGPPVHVSNTAVVVMAYDHGICTQLFQQNQSGHGSLDVNGFINCNKVLGRVVMKSGTKKDKKLESDMWQSEFHLWDKDLDGSLSEDEFLRYCAQYCGKKLKVAMKFMKNGDEYQREIYNREGLDDSFVLSLLPSVDLPAFQANLKTLKIHGGYPMTEYPHVMVMPAADRSFEDIYLKERPGENERRILLQHVAEGLQHLHKNKLVHGDVKKLNVIRVENRLKLIDLDAATAFGDCVGAKFSSGSLPPELFYKLASAEEIDLHYKHWANIESTNQELWQKVKPKGNFVVKSFQHEKDELPYALVKAHPSMDVWAFGALMYQIYSGEELVSTDINQDVLEKEIEEAATWTQENVVKRIRSKIISNAQVCDLLEKLLVVNPKNRPSMAAVLDHAYFKVNASRITEKVQEAIDKVVEVNTNVQQVSEKVARVDRKLDNLSKEHLKQLAIAKQDIMRGVFEATEVVIPTSFVILSLDFTKSLPENVQEKFDCLFKFMCTKTIDFGKSVAKAMKSDSAIISTGDPMFLYLVDEVEGTPVIPSTSDISVYPIRIDTQTPQFLAVAAPYLQAGLHLLKGIKTATTLAKRIGIPNPTKSVIDKAIKVLEATKAESSVVDFNIVHSAVQAGSESPRLVQRIRGAALRELERFFNDKDPNKTYAGLQRTYTVDGHALWTSRENAEKINKDKSHPETLMTHGQSNKIVLFYKKLLLVEQEKKCEGNAPNMMQKKEDIEEDHEERDSESRKVIILSPKKGTQKVCTCELM
ncbi:hypothetical protein As57867_020767, partial [Aphanomyces stellatus]